MKSRTSGSKRRKAAWKIPGMEWLARLFIRGLVTILPLGGTLALLYWLGISAERGLRRLIDAAFPGTTYLPGLGLVAGILFVLGVGLLMSARVFQTTFDWFLRPLEKIPVVRSIYGSLKDLMGYVGTFKEAGFGKVVMVDIAGCPVRLVGFVTRETFEDLPFQPGQSDSVAVYLPMSYQVGGYTVFIPRSWITPVNVGFDEAMRFVLTAGVTKKSEDA